MKSIRAAHAKGMPLPLRSIKTQRVLAMLLLCALSCLIGPSLSAAQEDWPEVLHGQLYLDRDVVVPGSDFRIVLAVEIEENYHINCHVPGDEFLIPSDVVVEKLPGFTCGDPIYPSPLERTYEFSEEPMRVYEGSVHFGIPARATAEAQPGDHHLEVTLSYQPCDQMACYPPEEKVFALDVPVVPLGREMRLANAEIIDRVDWGGPPSGEAPTENQFAVLVRERGLLLALLIVFVGGLALNLTPCVFPIIPITIGFFTSQSGGKTSLAFRLSLAYFLGITLCFSVLGTVAALTGSLFGALLQNPLVLILISGVLVYLALSMFGLYEIPLFTRLQGTTGGAKKGLAGAFLMGLTVGLAASPCIGPFVLGLLVFVGNTGDPLMGFLVFFVLAAGLGLPYIVLGTFSGMLSALPRAGSWMEVVKKILAVILFGLVFYFLRPLIPGDIYPLIFVAYLVLGGIVLFVVRTRGELKELRIIRYLVAVAFLLGGLYALYGAVHPQERVGLRWTEVSSLPQLQERLQAGRPTVVHFTAEWCAVCHELEEKTYSDPAVTAVCQGIQFLQVDLTGENEEKKRLREELGVRGLPTILFFDASGRERPQLRQSGFVGPERFAELIEELSS
jgi:thiol:disulfide interchange protein DsbD